jgi:predicted MFS family arabinose efflux permease
MVLRTTQAAATPRKLSQPAAYALAAAVIGLALFASGTPSPLYVTYRELWGFSPVVLTLVYATYAFGVLASLLLAGRASDEAGRRPVLLVGLAALMMATVLFMLADSVAWLFVARAIQGLATGLALASASAALLDLHPRRDASAVGLTNGVVSAAGMGLGVLVSATLVELAPAPRVLPYVVLFALFAVAFGNGLRMPEPVAARSRPRLTPQRPRVSATVRRPFVLAALAVMSSWSIGGLFLALGPQLAAAVFHSGDHFVTGVGVFALAGTGSLAQLVFRRTVPWRGAAAGSLALAAGVLLIVLAAATRSAVPFMAGCVMGGAGFGVAFLGALRALSGAIPDAHRAEVMSAFYVVAYASLSLPAVLAGVLVTPLGLETTFELFGSVVAALALVVAWEAWRTRPRPAAGRRSAHSAADGRCTVEAGAGGAAA